MATSDNEDHGIATALKTEHIILRESAFPQSSKSTYEIVQTLNNTADSIFKTNFTQLIFILRQLCVRLDKCMEFEVRGDFESYHYADRIGIGEQIFTGTSQLCRLTMGIAEELFKLIEFTAFEISDGVMPVNFEAFWGNSLFGENFT